MGEAARTGWERCQSGVHSSKCQWNVTLTKSAIADKKSFTSEAAVTESGNEKKRGKTQYATAK
jgi:hypothetical protein